MKINGKQEYDRSSTTGPAAPANEQDFIPGLAEAAAFEKLMKPDTGVKAPMKADSALFIDIMRVG